MTTPGADQAAATKLAEGWRNATDSSSILARAYLAMQQENAELRREKESRAPDRREPCKKCGYWVVRS